MPSPDLVLEPEDPRITGLIPGWDACAESNGGSFFQTGTWALAWWEHLADRPETNIAFWTDTGGSVTAVAAMSKIERPLLRGSGPEVTVWSNTGSGAGAGDHLGWPSARSARDGIIEWILETTRGPVMLSNLAPGQTAGLEMAGFERFEESPTLAATLGAGDEWFPGSNDFRKKLRYAKRQLSKLGVELEMVGHREIDRTLFTRLLELHAVRSESMGWSSHFDQDRLDFHMRLISSATDARGPMACVARQGDTVVGVLYGFRFGDTFAYYQTGWSREFVKQSLGSVLVATTMEWAAGEGLSTFDFLRGDDEYKRRFGAEPRTDETWLLDRGLAGKALKARQAAAGMLRKRSAS